ncbi:MAG: transaldolase [Pseudomonadales bacterium]
MTHALRRLRELGQSVWLDDLRRDYLEDGTLRGLIERDAVTGITTNPAIFARAVRESGGYRADIARRARAGAALGEIYEGLVVDDVRRAADLLRGVYDATAAADGYVSLEVSPHLADDSGATVEQARRLWAQVARPNLMIKVPGTDAGLPALRSLLAEGINVNVTLLFSVSRYRSVLESHRQGLEDRMSAGRPLDRVASVASFFLSRIDSRVDALLDSMPGEAAASLRGRAAIASAESAYEHFVAAADDVRWNVLAGHGAQRQRLLWASTSTKDPAYDEFKYVESLIAPDTVTTLPMATLIGYRQRGEPAQRLGAGTGEGGAISRALARLGVDLEEVAGELELDGVRKFAEPFDALMSQIDGQRALAIASRP